MKTALFSVIVGLAIVSLMTVSIQQVFASGSVEFVNLNDGDSVKGKKFALVTNLTGFEAGEYVQTIGVRNIANLNDNFSSSWLTSQKTPSGAGGVFTLVKGVTNENPNGHVVILVDTDFLQSGSTYELQLVVRSTSDPNNVENTSIHITIN